MSKTVMISQPRYLPFMGYLNRIRQADVFVVLDTVQRTQRGFENRNKMPDNKGVDRWLSIPVSSSSRSLIKDSKVLALDEQDWVADHINRLTEWYPNILNKSPERNFFDGYYFKIFDAVCGGYSYADILRLSLQYLLDKLEIGTKVIYASSLYTEEDVVLNGGVDGLCDIINRVEATHYISGPSCLEYGLNSAYLTAKTGCGLIIHRWNLGYYPFMYHLLNPQLPGKSGLEEVKFLSL